LQNSRQRSSTVLNLVTHEQSKWRKQVWNIIFYKISIDLFLGSTTTTISV
jgi:hypothetical protein